MVIEQLMNTLPSDVHVWVRERKPDTVAGAGQLADDYTLDSPRKYSSIILKRLIGVS